MNSLNKKIAFIVIFISILISAVYYNYTTYKKKDMVYVIEQRFSKGLFNKYKLNSITSTEIDYSDELLAIVSVTGVSKNSKDNFLSYKVLLEKSSNGSWKVKEVYPLK